LTYGLSDLTVIGRSSDPSTNLCLSHNSVSRRHAEIVKKTEGYTIIDHDSKNGTYINGKRITAPTVISSGDTLMIGRVDFLVESEEYSSDKDQTYITEQYLSNLPLDSQIDDMTKTSIEAATLQLVSQKSAKPSPVNAELLYLQIKQIAEITAVIREVSGQVRFESELASKILKMFPQAKRCMIIIKSSEGILTVRAAAFRSIESSDHVKISKTIINHVLEQEKSILSADAQQESYFSEEGSIAEADIHSFICAPLIGAKGPFGVIFLDVKAEVECFIDLDLTFLTVIANQVALAIENVQLVEHLGHDRDRLLEENIRLRDAEAAGISFEKIIFSSPKMKDILAHTKKVSLTDSSVIILGERGTGKELVAHAIHYNSPRKDKPFEIVNCASIGHELVESELFGHEKGAFTGADKAKPGLFEIANNGSLFLDEIADLPLRTQAKLLRAVENGQIRRLGGTKDIKVDVRVIAATNRDLKKEVEENRFRADLYDRLNVAVILLPSLSERKEDILTLANHFREYFRKRMNKDVRGFSADVWNILYQYDWPGNVRELRNVVEKAMIDVQGDTILASHLPAEITKVSIEVDRYRRVGKLSDAEAALKREMIIEALQQSQGNKSKAAETLGVSRAGLRKMMHSLGLENDFGKRQKD
jgi:Nif-specific regulatory protein